MPHDLIQPDKAAAAFRAHEVPFHAIIEAAPTGMVMVDSEGRIVMMNAQMERLFGYHRDELLGQPIETLLPKRYHANHWVLRKDFLAAPETRPMGQGRDLFALRKDASEFPVEIGLNPVETPEGCFVLASVVDITERKRAEKSLRQSETHFRALAEGLPQLVWTASADGVCDYVSPQWRIYSGLPEEKLLGLHGTLHLVHPDDKALVSSAWERAVATKTPLDYEFRIRHADGEYRWFRAWALPQQDSDGRIVKWIGTNTDIDEQRRARTSLETEIRTRTAQLQASLDSLEELLYTIAHDLRAPNRAMQGFAHLLKFEYGERLDDTARDYLERISTSAVRNDQLIRDLLEYGRVSHESLSLAPTDLGESVAAVLQALEKDLKHRQARIRVGQDWPRVLANGSMLKQILTNFLTNALQYVPADKEPEIEISAVRENEKAVLRVKDNGIGILADQIDRAFKPFVRLPNALHAPGTGMGLAIVKRAVERMNGEVGAESAPGKGSCFWVELWAA